MCAHSYIRLDMMSVGIYDDDVDGGVAWREEEKLKLFSVHMKVINDTLRFMKFK